MKHFIILLTLMFTSLSAQAQFSQAIGEPGTDFQTTQIRTLGGNTYISGWLTDPNANAPTLSAEGILVCLNANGDIDWIYKLSSDNQFGIPVGTRIFDFDFDDGGDHAVFVGSTADTNGGIVNNQCIVGMVDINTGVGVLQESYDFRITAREFFFEIANNPSTNPLDVDTYIISGIINESVVGTRDNYLNGRATITPGGVIFAWIQENDYPGISDEEMQGMRVLDVAGNLEVVQLGSVLPGLLPRINFHNIATGIIISEFAFNLPGTTFDATQIGNTMIVVGRLNGSGAFIASIDLLTNNLTSHLIFDDLTSFSRVIIEPISGQILAMGERNGANPAICRFDLSGTPLNYINSSVLDFGINGPDGGLLVTAGNEAFFADTRSMLASFGANLSAAVVRTDLDFFSCETDTITFPHYTDTLAYNQQSGVMITQLAANPVDLVVETDTLCAISLCGNGFNLDTLLTVFHGSRSHYVNVADINNDGWQDFAIPDIGFGGTPRFNISTNNQNLTFTNTTSTSSNLAFEREAKSMQFIDLDGLGALDLVILRIDSVQVFVSSNNVGTYTSVQTIPLTSAPLTDPSNTVGIGRANFKLVDHTNNGFEDLVVVGPETGGNPLNRIAIYEGTGSATSPFTATPVQTLQGRESIKYWETVHVDIDGVLGNDLFVGEADYNQATQSIFGYLNNGTAIPFNATPDITYETPTGFIWPRGMEIIDIDGNFQSDLIVTMQAASLNGGVPTGQGALLISRDIPSAPGVYTAASLQWEIINIPGQPVGIAIDDIDGSGANDIAVAVHNGSPVNTFVRVYENNGVGNFPNFIDVNTPIGQTIELEIADFNNDCCKDIVTTQWNGAMSYVLINDCQVTEFPIRGQVVCESDTCDFFSLTNNGVPNQSVVISDGNNTYIAITDANGDYTIDVPAGNYNISVANANYGGPGCINANIADVIGFQPANNINTVNFIIESQCLLDVNMVGGFVGSIGANTCPFEATPCEDFIWEYCFEIENNTCIDQIIDEITILLPNGIDGNSINIGTLVDCVAQTPVTTITPTHGLYTSQPNLFSHSVEYNLNSTLAILPGECFSACVQATFDGNFTLPVTAEIDVDYICDSNNLGATSGVEYQDTCSCDPNLKLAYFPQNCGTLDELLDQPIEYTIHFSNIGLSAAYDIRVLDQLDNNLDFSTFQWLGSSHPTGSINIANGLLDVYFNNINLPSGGSGWLRFSVKPNGTTTNYTTISNYADIIFDNNAPVSTNTTETTIQASTAQADLQFNGTEFCVGDDIVIDFTWTGDAAWLNFTQNGASIGQNVSAPPSGHQTTFTIPNNTYVGLWEYELVAYDSITGCTDTSLMIFNIYDCDCDLDDQISMSITGNSYQFSSNVFDPLLNPGFNITQFKWDLGDGTISNDQSPIHKYNCKKFGPHTVVVCLYYVAEINGQICEGEICQEFDVCQKDFFKNSNIYPNPASNQITVQSEAFHNQTDLLTVETYSIEGKLLKTYTVKPDYDRIYLNIDNNYRGLVYMRILNNRGEVLLEDRFIKLKNRTN